MARVQFFLLMLTLALAIPTVQANVIMFGGNGGHPNPDGSPLSINNGWLVIVDQTTGAITPVGHPAGVSKLSGLAFEPNGDLFGTSLNADRVPPVRRLGVRDRRRHAGTVSLPWRSSSSASSSTAAAVDAAVDAVETAIARRRDSARDMLRMGTTAIAVPSSMRGIIAIQMVVMCRVGQVVG